MSAPVLEADPRERQARSASPADTALMARAAAGWQRLSGCVQRGELTAEQALAGLVSYLETILKPGAALAAQPARFPPFLLLDPKEECMKYDIVNTPIGRLLLAGDDAGLRFVDFLDGPGAKRSTRGWERDPAPFRAAAKQLAEYFAGKRRTFELELAPEGTSFRRVVWRALQKVAYGKTVSYGELARRIGKPKAARAVGAAVGANPLGIVIPCHRVIGADGSLTGFGGGLPVKRKLLAVEGR